MVVPTLLILEISLVPGLRPGQPTDGYGLGNYLQIFQPVYLGVVLRTVKFALVTTIACLLLGFPVAYWLALMSPNRPRGQSQYRLLEDHCPPNATGHCGRQPAGIHY